MGRDPDNWFDEPDLSEPPRRRATAPRPEAPPPEPEAPGDGRPSTRTTAAIAGAAGLVVVIVVVLLVTGVFESGSSPSTAPTTTAPATTTHPATTTTPAPSHVPVPTQPLAPGDNGTEVATLQRALGRAGYPVGTVDGDYGPATKDAVARFQASENLTADGIAGPQTLAALNAKVNGP
jgi:hypothetical protein